MHSNIFSNQYILNKMNKFEEFKNGKVAISHDVTAEEMKIILTEAFPKDLVREDQKEVYNRKDKIYYREETLSEMHGHSIWCTIFPEWKSIKTYKASEILEELNAKTFAEWCDYINSPAVKLQMYQKEEIERFKHFLTQTDSIKRHPCRGKSIVQNLIENGLRAERPEQSLKLIDLGNNKSTRSKENEYRWRCGMLEIDAEINQEAIKTLQNQKNIYQLLFTCSVFVFSLFIIMYMLYEKR